MRRPRPKTSALVGGLFVVLLAAAPISAQAGTDLWVLTESQQIFTIDTKTLVLDTTPISLAGLTTSDPTCMAFSSVAGAPASVFVTQGNFIRVVDVVSETVHPNPIHVAALIGVPEIELTACAAARPRTFRDGSLTVTRSRLFVAGKTRAGDTRYAVLNQAAVIAGSGSLVAEFGRLRASGNALDIKVLDDPQGDAYQRAWFTVSDIVGPDEVILNYPMSLPDDLDNSIDIGAPEVLTLPTVGLPGKGVGVGSAPAGKFAVQPGYTTGLLTNLDTGDSCSIPGSPAQLSIHGPGPNSYSVFALDPLTKDLLAINPNDCSSVAFDVGGTPVAMVPRRTQFWDGLFVLNNSGDSVDFVEPDGDLLSIPLPSGVGPIGGGVVQGVVCSPDNLLLAKLGDAIELTWSAVGCAPETEFFAWCNCIDDDLNCPCACDCSMPPQDLDCACPFAQTAIGGTGVNGLLLNYNPGDLPTQNPWKRLENTSDPTLIHEEALTPGSWFYLINQSDEPPNPNP